MDGESCRRKALLDKSEWRRSEIRGKKSGTNEWVATIDKGKSVTYSTKTSGDVMKYVLSVTPEWVATVDEGECLATKRKYVVKYSEAQ